VGRLVCRAAAETVLSPENGWLAVNETPAHVQSHGIPRKIDHHWLRALLSTMALVAMVAAAAGAELSLAIAGLALSGVGFGFFYLLFPGGSGFGITVANAVAVYLCVFQFFREASFPLAPEFFVFTAGIMPVIAFLFACILNRRAIGSALRARRRQDIQHLPRLGRWFPSVAIVAAASFAVPRLHLDPAQQGYAIVAGMLLISGSIGYAVRDVVLLLMEVAVVFESVRHRLRRLLMPMIAFLTYYSLLVVLFACLYRIAQYSAGNGQFLIQGRPGSVSFSDALYFSVITIATVGYGDITPGSALVRALASIQVVLGVLLLLFGFSEIMRAGTAEPPRRPRLPPDNG
jgi:voltage-gated potassium channel